MRAVNLIPPEEQRGDRAPMRAGIVSYVVVGALALGLLLVIATALTGKQISDKKAEKQQLEQELTEATARAESLRAFADFRAVQESRTATVSSLAQSRFDWERVLRELALTIPGDVWLVSLTGTVSPAVSLENGAEIPVRDSVAGPALELVGCAPSQDAVAAMIAALEDIDGVTRVGVGSSERPDDSQNSAPTPGEQNDDCRTRDFISKFELVAAFDAVPAPPTATAAPAVPAPLSPPPGEAVPASAQNATDLVPGG
ncbi:MAG: PilN domain-containing protein [Solirubrobacterales bacterium]|nr:PilN domain-containing protein [Solirubrobacterales bacterium]